MVSNRTPNSFEIPMVVPSLNTLLRTHWAARKRLQKQWLLVMKANANAQRVAGVFKNVRIHAFRKRKLDHDNFVGGCKEVLIDNLKELGLIKDDSPKHLLAEYNQSLCRARNEGTMVVLW